MTQRRFKPSGNSSPTGTGTSRSSSSPSSTISPPQEPTGPFTGSTTSAPPTNRGKKWSHQPYSNPIHLRSSSAPIPAPLPTPAVPSPAVPQREARRSPAVLSSHPHFYPTSLLPPLTPSTPTLVARPSIAGTTGPEVESNPNATSTVVVEYSTTQSEAASRHQKLQRTADRSSPTSRHEKRNKRQRFPSPNISPLQIPNSPSAVPTAKAVQPRPVRKSPMSAPATAHRRDEDETTPSMLPVSERRPSRRPAPHPISHAHPGFLFLVPLALQLRLKPSSEDSPILQTATRPAGPCRILFGLGNNKPLNQVLISLYLYMNLPPDQRELLRPETCCCNPCAGRFGALIQFPAGTFLDPSPRSGWPVPRFEQCLMNPRFNFISIKNELLLIYPNRSGPSQAMPASAGAVAGTGHGGSELGRDREQRWEELETALQTHFGTAKVLKLEVPKKEVIVAQEEAAQTPTAAGAPGTPTAPRAPNTKTTSQKSRSELAAHPTPPAEGVNDEAEDADSDVELDKKTTKQDGDVPSFVPVLIETFGFLVLNWTEFAKLTPEDLEELPECFALLLRS